jgi:diketogulonate reductase-like aldo/keto reductase
LIDFGLNTGQRVPAIGFGTWEVKRVDTRAAVLAALEAGYRIIDTAKIYGNEREVGQAIRDSGLKRNELFITTKLWNNDQGYDSTLSAVQTSLDYLGLDYLDLYLIHWPATHRRADSWRAFEKLAAEGTIKAAGVSNYTVDHLKELLGESELVPAINQVEFHPFIYEQQRQLLDFCREKEILIEAYSPISRIAHDVPPDIQTIADAHNKSPQQIILRWCIQHGTLPLPRSRSSEHIKSNLEVFDFTLSDGDMASLNSLSDGERVTWDPAGMGT